MKDGHGAAKAWQRNQGLEWESIAYGDLLECMGCVVNQAAQVRRQTHTGPGTSLKVCLQIAHGRSRLNIGVLLLYWGYDV